MTVESVYDVSASDYSKLPGTKIFGEPIFTIKEASVETRLAEWTLWSLLKQGKLQRTKVAGKTFLRLSELQKLLVDKTNAEPKKRKRAKARKAAQEAR